MVTKGPPHQQAAQLDEVFGPNYFDHGRLVFTVARDIPGVMKVAHRLHAKTTETVGAMVEVIMEHVKHEYWLKLHESVSNVGLQKGHEVPDCQVTDIPDGIRQHPYRRDHLPTLEVLLLWTDIATGVTKGRVLYSCAHPEVPSLDAVDDIFSQIEPYFAKRWLHVQLCLDAPVKGEFEDAETQALTPESLHVGAGVGVTLLACHPHGFASGQYSDGGAAAAHVSQCKPMSFKAVTDDAGQAKICFLPAAVNKIQISETDRFHGSEVSLMGTDIKSMDQGSTKVTVNLTPKALAMAVVHVFEMPRTLPQSEDTDGIIDWAAEERTPLPAATVQMRMMKDGAVPTALKYSGNGDDFIVEEGGLAEGCLNLEVSCPGYEAEERALMLLVGPNEFYVPLKASAC
eukprot:TRINITY_DN97668_c0_g1_i1.p1 TRINITY_DN97668_c0_g1~~TRINITY_DN97668_c0_g1_i1.p1  ORF type:complete len:430 (+),score=88.64 TRINITY_DN97668_c0_g1_i1:93-1292(+)